MTVEKPFNKSSGGTNPTETNPCWKYLSPGAFNRGYLGAKVAAFLPAWCEEPFRGLPS